MKKLLILVLLILSISGCEETQKHVPEVKLVGKTETTIKRLDNYEDEGITIDGVKTEDFTVESDIDTAIVGEYTYCYVHEEYGRYCRTVEVVQNDHDKVTDALLLTDLKLNFTEVLDVEIAFSVIGQGTSTYQYYQMTSFDNTYGQVDISTDMYTGVLDTQSMYVKRSQVPREDYYGFYIATAIDDYYEYSNERTNEETHFLFTDLRTHDASGMLPDLITDASNTSSTSTEESFDVTFSAEMIRSLFYNATIFLLGEGRPMPNNLTLDAEVTIQEGNIVSLAFDIAPLLNTHIFDGSSVTIDSYHYQLEYSQFDDTDVTIPTDVFE